MINDFAFTFVIVPCIAACTVAAIIRDWRLAAAALCGALGLTLIAPALPPAIAYLGLPVFVGIALGALAVMVALLRRPSHDIWGRMLPALIFTFAVTFAHLLYFANGA